MRFWDSSSLIPLFVREAHTASLEALADDDPGMILWWASPVECASAVHRLRREGAFTPAQAGEVLPGRHAVLRAGHDVQPGDDLSATALRLLATHALRAGDALQLAAALVWARGRPSGKAFVCLDQRLRTAAALEGFSVEPASI
jgi:predicted nucleic acid-binding protein